ncbi:DUF916 domain-containing protein [Membranicola marinus]|uniref:DUF916 domain-containing protein n=1 Tax=Membranihabitans marinus TaxID=1227546 RepID=A0A953HU88_9BACT|nr:DUF916 domain-containing protein [Membranihabitans marinus]MBY5957978.1 DUF916 domain-containing protein [Membranihabitans marinus]
MRFCFLVFVFTIFTNSSGAAQGVSMSPTRLFFSGNPGETVTETVILNNSSDADYTLSINYKDWERNIHGDKVYYESGTLEKSNASWVSTLENTVTIPANSTKEIVVTMKIPETVADDQVTNCMMFFTQLATQADEAAVQGGIGIITLFEFGLHIYHTPPSNSVKSLEITNMEEVTDTDTESRKAAVTIFNDGNVVNDATVEFELTNTDTGTEIKLDPRPISMMPGSEQVVLFPLPEELSGNYLGVTIVKMAGSNDMRVGEKTFAF